MTDERFCFVSDLREKKKTATGAHHKRTHCGKGGAVKFPSDYLSRKELKNMSGEVQAYRLNDPMRWDEFSSMPEDLQIAYVKLLRQKFDVPDSYIGKMLGVERHKISAHFKAIGLEAGKQGYRKWDTDVWMSFVEGRSVLPSTSYEDISEPEPVEVKTVLKQDGKQKAVPHSGSLSFVGRVEDVLNSVAVLVGGANVHITITWEQAGVSDGN